jgi:hypothetical protein
MARRLVQLCVEIEVEAQADDWMPNTQEVRAIENAVGECIYAGKTIIDDNVPGIKVHCILANYETTLPS